MVVPENYPENKYVHIFLWVGSDNIFRNVSSKNIFESPISRNIFENLRSIITSTTSRSSPIEPPGEH